MIPDYKKILEERRKRECTNKIVKYSTLQAAARGRKRMEGRFPDQQFQEYYCEFCGSFHVGHARFQQTKGA